MINETTLLLSPLKDCSSHRLKCAPYWGFGHPWDLYCYEPLKALFSKVVVYDYIKRMTEINLKGVNRELIDLVGKEHPKYVVWPSVNYEFLESTFDIIRREGVILVGFFFDDEFRFDNYSKYWIPHLDYCVTNDIEAVPKYRELGARVIYTFVCHAIAIDRDWSDVKEKYDVSFVGSRKYDREQYINEIRQRNIPVHVVGPGWGKIVAFEEMIDIFESSKINLNFSKTEGDKLAWKGRIVQVVNAGGFLLTEYRPGIENFFDIDKEIVCFRNAEEMIDKITYYLERDSERRAIAQAGWKRGTGEYTPFRMMSRVFGEIEEDIAAKGKKSNLYPRKLNMPMRIRKLPSNYYKNWGRAFLLENYEGLWKDPLMLSLSYNPFNIEAWFWLIVGFFPSSIRLRLVQHIERIYTALRPRLRSLPYWRKTKQRFT